MALLRFVVPLYRLFAPVLRWCTDGHIDTVGRFLVRFQFKFHCTDGHSDTVGVAMDQQPDLFGSFNVLLPMVTLTLLAIVLFNVASLCCRSYRGTLLSSSCCTGAYRLY
jgi:hypothetical protein